MGFTALIPFVGAYIGAVVGALMILTVSPLKAALFWFSWSSSSSWRQPDLPKVVGKSIGLPAIWVLAGRHHRRRPGGVWVCSWGVPITLALYRLLREDLHRREAAEPSAAASPTASELEA